MHNSHAAPAPRGVALIVAAALVVLVGAAQLASCSTPRANKASGDISNPKDPTVAGLLDEYRIGVGDALRVSVWGNEELSVEVVVLPDGRISAPLAGELVAAGETTASLSTQIATVLGKYIRQPEVTVSVLSAVSSEYLQRVRITGAVNSPLSLDYRRGMTVLDMVLLAGGLTPFADPNRSLLYREEDSQLNAYPVRLEDILSKGRLDTNYRLLPADIITVPEKRF